MPQFHKRLDHILVRAQYFMLVTRDRIGIGYPVIVECQCMPWTSAHLAIIETPIPLCLRPSAHG